LSKNLFIFFIKKQIRNQQIRKRKCEQCCEYCYFKWGYANRDGRFKQGQWQATLAWPG